MEHDNLYSSVIRRERQVILVGKITGKARLLSAARHNLREIQAELGANSHIDPIKTQLNTVRHGAQTAVEVMAYAEQLIRAAGIEMKPPRKPDPAGSREFHPTEFLREENQIQ